MTSQWDGILRCKTFNVWPTETTSELPPLEIDYGAASPISVQTFVHAWAPKLKPEVNEIEPTQLGHRLWDGAQPGLQHVWDAILLGVGEQVQLAQPDPRPAHRGELDIQLSFEFDEDPSMPLVEALRTHAFEILALLNLGLGDFLTPTMPFQIRKVLPDNEVECDLDFKVEVRPRQILEGGVLGDLLMGIAHFLSDPSYQPKFRIALELYAAHFTELEVRVRFILLVIAMEALAEATEKHSVATTLIDRWKQELKAERARYEKASEEYRSLDALYQEIQFRGDISLGERVRKQFAVLPGITDEERKALQDRAMIVYRKRSKLVHEGRVPVEELPDLEHEARELVEMLLVSAIDQSKAGEARYKVVRPEPAQSSEGSTDGPPG